MAKRAKHGILATTAKLCGVLRDAGLRNFSRNIRQRDFSNATDKGILPVSRVFLVRRVLYQLGGIQSMSALPGDRTFNQFNNHYDEASYKRICAEFGIDPFSDFRFTIGKNHGLGNIYVYTPNANMADHSVVARDES